MGYSCALAWILVVIIDLATAILFKTQNAWVHYEEVLPWLANRKTKNGFRCVPCFSCLLGFIMIYPLLWLVASSFKSKYSFFYLASR